MVPLKNLSTKVEYTIQDDQQSLSDVDVPLHNETLNQYWKPKMSHDILLRRSIRDRHPSTYYSIEEYV